MNDTLTGRLTSDGFVVLERACSTELLATLLRVCRERSRAVRDALGDREIGIGSAAGYIELVQRSPGRWDVPITPAQFGIDERAMPWWPWVTAALGDAAEHAFSGVVSSDPRTPAQHWHIDSPHEAARHLPAHAISVLVALHDVPMVMGPTEFARGSHRLTNHLDNPSLQADELLYQHAETSPESLVSATGDVVPQCCAVEFTAGSCLVFDDRLLHRGLANRSEEVRHVAYFGYRRRGYVGTTHFESRRSLFDGPS